MEHGWYAYSLDYKIVADYCNMSIVDVGELDVIMFKAYYRDARIVQLSKTDEGQEYLRNAWRFHDLQTKPDRKGLREIKKEQ